MAKITVISGFLGAGKTTLIKKLLEGAFPGEKLVLIENEFGEISVDSGFLKDSGVEISEMSSGCICCSLVGDFRQALLQVWEQYKPDRILIEPSGVGKLSDVVKAVEDTVAGHGELSLHSAVTVADASKVRLYMKNFGEFYNDQIEHADAIILSRTQKLTAEKLEAALELLRERNPRAAIVTTPWDELSPDAILRAMERHDLALELLHEHEHEHHHEHDEHCTCTCHDHDHEHEHEHDHEHDHEHEHEHDHEHDHEHEHKHEHEHEHEHHHEHDENCTCGCHDHDHHHHADEVFTSWGVETPRIFTRSTLEEIMVLLSTGAYGTVLRAKGIVRGPDRWLEFDYVPGEWEIRHGKPDYTGRLCVIGSQLHENTLAALFGV